MKTIYTRPVCPACHVLKAKLTKDRVPFEAITVVNDNEPVPPGLWISRSEFAREHPGVRAFPFVADGRTHEVQPNGDSHMVDPLTRQHYAPRTGELLDVAKD